MDAAGFFQGAAGLALFEGTTLPGPLRSQGSTSGDGFSWVKGSTFAIGCVNLHLPHCFWEVHALFSLAQYDVPAQRPDQLWVLTGRGMAEVPLFSSEDSGAIESNLKRGQQGRSFFEEMLLVIAPFVQAIHIANVYADAGPVCFEQLTVLREPPGLSIFRAKGPNSNCWVGFFSTTESELFKRHVHEAYSLTERPDGNRMTALQRRSTRVVRNLQALVDAARAMRFQTDIVVLEQMSYREQMRQFTITTILLAPTGAALINMAMLPTGSHYIEIPANGYVKDECYYAAHALSLGVNYHDLCNGVCTNFAESNNLDLQYQPIYITPAHVDALRRVLGVLQVGPSCAACAQKEY
jgi:hypothetical protein